MVLVRDNLTGEQSSLPRAKRAAKTAPRVITPNKMATRPNVVNLSQMTTHNTSACDLIIKSIEDTFDISSRGVARKPSTCLITAKIR